MRRPRRTGGRRGRGRRVVEDSPRASEGFATTVPGEDAAGGEGRFRRQGGVRIPTGGGTTAHRFVALDPHGGRGRAPATRLPARSPRGEGPASRVTRGEAPSHGGTTRPRRGLFMGLQRLATLSTKLLAREVALHSACPRFASYAGFAVFRRWRNGSRESTSRRQRTRWRVGGECSASSGNSSASRANPGDLGVACRGRGSTLRY